MRFCNFYTLADLPTFVSSQVHVRSACFFHYLLSQRQISSLEDLHVHLEELNRDLRGPAHSTALVSQMGPSAHHCLYAPVKNLLPLRDGNIIFENLPVVYRNLQPSSYTLSTISLSTPSSYFWGPKRVPMMID